MRDQKHPYITPIEHGVLIHVLVTPGSRRSRIVGPHGDRLKIAIAAPASEGRANIELVEFLSALFKLPKSAISISRGQSSKYKTVLVTGVVANVLTEQLKI